MIAQAGLYLMNKIDSKHMTMTDEEVAQFQADSARAIREKGGDVKRVKEGDPIEDVLGEPKKKPEDLN